MRKLLCVLPLFLLLAGCRHPIRANYRDIEDLQLAETLGFDRVGERVVVSVSSGKGTKELPAVHLTAEAASLPEAIDRLQDWSARRELFFAHIRYVVVGEAAAREGLDELLDWFERSTQTRLALPLFVAEGGTAQTLLCGSDDPEYEITEVLSSLERDARRRGQVWPFTLADTARSLSQGGSALCISLRAAGTGGSVPTSPEGLAALETGFAVFCGGRLAAFSGQEAAQGLCLLLGLSGADHLSLSDGRGGQTALELGQENASLRLRRRPDGGLRLEAALRCRAGVTAVSPADAPPDPAALDDAFSVWLAGRAEAALALTARTGADVLGLARRFPAVFAGEDPGTLLQGMDWTVDAEGRVEESFDLLAPVATRGEEGRHVR